MFRIRTLHLSMLLHRLFNQVYFPWILVPTLEFTRSPLPYSFFFLVRNCLVGFCSNYFSFVSEQHFIYGPSVSLHGWNAFLFLPFLQQFRPMQGIRFPVRILLEAIWLRDHLKGMRRWIRALTSGKWRSLQKKVSVLLHQWKITGILQHYLSVISAKRDLSLGSKVLKILFWISSVMVCRCSSQDLL